MRCRRVGYNKTRGPVENGIRHSHRLFGSTDEQRYDKVMNLKLSPQMTAALNNAPSGTLEVVDPETNRVYVICDPALQNKAKALLDKQAIAEGIADVAAGRTQPLEDAFNEIRRDVGLPPK